jgi:hypothetical protein
MKKTASVAVIVAVLCLVAACSRSETPSSTSAATAASPVEGEWRVAEVTVTGANPSTTVDPPSLFIFTKTHYAMMRAIGSQPRASFKAVNPTSEEKIAAYDSFIANAGTYELSATTLTVRPVVSKHPNFMGGGFDTYEVRSEGDTLWLTGKSTNIRYRIGDGLASDPDPADETTLRLVRIQ